MSSCRDDLARILDFWRAVEYFTPVDLKLVTAGTAGSKEIWNSEWHSGPLPWLEKSKSTESNKTPLYIVCLGVVKIATLLADMKMILKETSEEDLETPPNEETCLSVFVVDHRGRPVPGTFILSSLSWAMGKLKAGDLEKPEWKEDFQQKSNEITTAYEDWAREDNNTPLVEQELNQWLSRVVQHTGWAPSKYAAKILVAEREVWARQKETSKAEMIEVFNSFIARDLFRIRSEVLVGNAGNALMRYLMGHSAERYDLIADIQKIEHCIEPDKLPLGRWPAPVRHPLVLMQQIAVNLALRVTKDQGLFSVNGPPGTGKTTILRDIVAALLVERAKVLVTFDDPSKAFMYAGEVSTGNGIRVRVYNPDPAICGFEVVVASSNNKAVENVTKEIPGGQAVDESLVSTSDPGYFSQVASNLLDGEPAWALLAAVLGKRANRSDFVQRFWFGGDSSFKHELDRALDRTQESLMEEWEASRVEFRKNVSTLETCVNSMKCALDASRKIPAAKAKVAEIENHIQRLLERSEELCHSSDENQHQINALDDRLGGVRSEIKEVLKESPGWLAFFLQRARWRVWKEQLYNARRKEAEILHDRKEYQDRLKKILNERLHISKEIEHLRAELDDANAFLNQQEEIVQPVRQKLDGNFADEIFWSLPDKIRQITSPWTSEKINRLRTQVFLSALKVHKAFIWAAAKEIRANLGLFVDLLQGNFNISQYKALVTPLWQTFFLVVPVVSTTFASLDKLFIGLERESLGWLLVDEAGQVTPQAVVGALWRSKRAVFVGDPLQLEPIVRLPSSMIELLREREGVSRDWDPSYVSAQIVADRANSWGTSLGISGNATWIGCPLRVHRRCLKPMFEISNTIAYDGMMVCRTKAGDYELPELGETRWIDVRSEKAQKHWIPAQGEVLIKLLSRTRYKIGMPDLFVISPFRSVSWKARKLLVERYKEWTPSENSVVKKWVDGHVGTVHTFQGKEASAVILLLGGNPKKPAALDWAASKPNLLNVAVTRARQRLYIIGDHSLWSRRPYFTTLAKYVPVEGQDQSLSQCAAQ